MTRIRELVAVIYGEKLAESVGAQIHTLIAEFFPAQPTAPTPEPAFFDETNALLITYGDMVQTADEVPLHTLRRFLEEKIAGIVKGVHILPFYPYSSDDGFLVIDYLQVNPELGTWVK